MFKKSDVEVFVNGLINGFNTIQKNSTQTDIVIKDKLNGWIDKFNSLNHNVNTTASEFAKFYTNIGNQNIVDHFKKIQASGNDASASIDGVMTAMVGQTTGFKNVRNIIAQYNSATSQGITYQNELAQIVSNSNLSLGQYLANLNGSKAGMLGYISSLIKGKAATIGLTLATTALNAVVSMGASLLVTTVITGITNWINAEEIAAEKAEEARQKALEAAEAYQEETEALSDLQARYTELITSTNDITTIRSELSSLQNELVEKYGEEAECIDLVNGKYSEQIKLLREKRKEEAEDYVRQNKAVYDTAQKEMSKDSRFSRKLGRSRNTSYSIDDAVISIEAEGSGGWGDTTRANWESLGLDNIHFKRSQGALLSNHVYISGTLQEQYDTLLAMADLYSQQDGYHEDRYQLIIDEANKLKEQIDSNNQIISQYEAQESLLEGINSGEYPQTADEYKFDTLLDKALELNGVLQSDSLTPSAYVSTEKELQNIKTQMEAIAQGNPLFQASIEEVFGSIESGSLSASTSLSTLKEQFSAYFDDSFTPALDNISKIEEAMQSLKDGELLDFNSAWDIIDLDEEGLLSKISQINGEMKLDHEELIALKDQLITKVREQIVEDNQAAQASIDSAKIRLEAEMAVLRAKQMSVNSASDIQYLEQQRQIVQDIKDEISGYENIIDKNYLLLRQLNSHLGDTVDYTQAIESEMSQIEDRISDIKDEVNALQEKADNLLKAQEEKIDGIIDKLEDEKEVLNDQLEIYEKQQEELEEIIGKYEQVADVVGETIQKEIDSIEEQRTQVEDYYDNLIDNLREANEEREDALNMAEKLAAVENAKNNKVRVYREDVGWNYEVDKEALKNAENDLLSAQNEAEIKKLEKEKEKAVEGYDEQIKGLEEYAELWEEVVNSITEAENELTATEILGSDWREKIKNKDTTILTKFKSNFTAYNTQLSSLVNNEIATLKKSIEAKEAEIESWQDYQSQIQQAAKAIETAYSDYAGVLSSITLTENSNWQERQNNLSAFTTAYKDYIDQISSKNGEIKTLESNLDSLATKLSSIDSSSLTNSLGDLQSVLAEVGDFETALDEINSMVEKFADNPMMFGTINSESDKKRYDLLKTLAELLGIEGFSQGGIHDTTGLAMMHGSKSASEVTFNATDAKKLYQLVHSTPNLVASMQESVMNAIGKNGMLTTSNTNNKTIINNHEWKFGDIVANDPTTFAQLINNYFGTKVTESKVF